ncbi:MAG: MFS transporter [Bacillota bacterium]
MLYPLLSVFFLLYFINQVQSKGTGFIAGIAFASAVIAGIYFLHIEICIPQPMVNLALFRNRYFTLGTVSSLLNFASQYILVFLTPFYLQRVIHYTPDKIGLLMTCFPFAVMVVAPFSGALSDRLGTRELAFSGAAVFAAALLAMAFLPVAACV